MTTFSSKSKITFCIVSDTNTLIMGPNGPQQVNYPAKMFTLNIGMNEVADEEVIKRLKSDSKFGVIFNEVTEEDKEVIRFKNTKMKEMEEGAKEIRKKKKV